MIDLIKELLLLLKHNKKIYLIPLIIIFLLFGFLIVSTQGTLLAPFVYTLF